jgi:hypothetical protein
MTAVRWFLGVLLALLSLVAAQQAVLVYAEHELWLGTAAVLVLMVMDVGGFLSLAWARWRLRGELRGLAAHPPAGSLWDRRRQALEAVARAGVSPDVEALTAATAAEETGRAYLGRYFVAVTVLVGLVGTFAGLMETLRTVAPLLSDDKSSVLGGMAATLAGLDLTFGASIVGILVTLTLSLVQGDLVVAEETTLARLHERTVHLLVPELWPAAASPTARMTAEMEGLRREVGQSVSHMAEETARRVAAAVTPHVERLTREVGDAVRASAQASTAGLGEALAEVARRVVDDATPLLAEQSAQLRASRQSLVTAGGEVSAALHQAASAAVQAMTEAAAQSREAHARAEASLRDDARSTREALVAAAAAHADRVEAATRAVQEAVSAAVGHLRDAHDSAQRAQATALERTLDQGLASHAQTRETLARVQEEVTRALQVSTTHVVTRHDESSRALAQATDAHLARVAGAAEEARAAVAQVHGVVTAATGAMGALVERTAREQQALLNQAAEEARTNSSLLDDVVRAAAARMEESTQGSHDVASRVGTQVREALEGFAREAVASMASSAREHAEGLARTAEALQGAVRHELGEAGTHLRASGTDLLGAAAALQQAAAALTPAVAALAPELQALAHEVAALAARADDEDGQTAILDEVARLGEGLERLEGLLRLSQGGGRA